jgi:hypothetical protein
MKTDWTVGWLFFFLAGLPVMAMAQAAPGGVPAGNTEALVLVMPIAVQDDDHRSALRLRDVLRQPYEGTQEPGSKPYRLTPQERHRLREQLRGQPDGGVVKGKS